MKPTPILRSCADLPACGGQLGPELEDFCVDEIPAYEACGEGEHLFVRLEKRGLTTPELLRHVARVAGVRDRDIGVAGMKDKHAVTTQWVSLLAQMAFDPEDWELGQNIRVLETRRHKNKLRTGHQNGNRFKIRLVGVVPEALARAQAIGERIGHAGLPNYFGPQRFGRDSDNLQKALDWLAAQSRSEGEGPRSKRREGRFKNKLWPSVIQSELFNRYVTQRLSRGMQAPMLGEVMRLNGTNSLFAVTQPDRELPRWRARDIIPTGPMIGPKMKAAEARAAELEAGVVAELQLTEQALIALGRAAPGTRRDLLVWPAELQVTQFDSSSLTLEFALPSGSYATVLIAELTG